MYFRAPFQAFGAGHCSFNIFRWSTFVKVTMSTELTSAVNKLGCMKKKQNHSKSVPLNAQSLLNMLRGGL